MKEFLLKKLFSQKLPITFLHKIKIMSLLTNMNISFILEKVLFSLTFLKKMILYCLQITDIVKILHYLKLNSAIKNKMNLNFQRTNLIISWGMY